MQHPMWLRGIITGIVFKLDMQFGAQSSPFGRTSVFFANDKVLLLLYAHTIAKLRIYWQLKKH